MEITVSSFTRQLVRDLKEQFVDGRSAAGSVQNFSQLLGLSPQQQQQVQSNSQTKRDAIGMSILLARSNNTEIDTGSISDECYIFTHIVDCVKSLMELTESKRKTSATQTQPSTSGKPNNTSSASVSDSSMLYTGFLSNIEKVLKEVLLPSSELFSDCSTSPMNDSLNRNVVTLHTLSAFPSLTQSETTINNNNNNQVMKKLPLLHYAAYNAEAIDLVKAVYNSNTANIRARDKTGALPLHWAILNKQAPEVTQFLLEQYPDAASLPDTAGYLPLHWAVNNDTVNMSIIKTLLEKCPSAASTPSVKNKTLPLHWCVNRSEPNLALVKELIISYPEAIQTPCDHGWLPLHYCVNRAKVSLTILRLLLDKYPAGVSYRNSDGQMALHRLLDRYEPNRKAVKWLIEAEPATLKACDSEGYLPLHVALDGSKPPSWRLIKLLLQHAPQTVEIATLDGFLPLHIAMKMQDRFGNPALTASQASSGGGNNQADDDNKDHTSSDGQSALEREAALKLNQNRYLSIVQELVTLYPEAVHLPAVDIIPVKEGVDPDTWEGQWRKSRWTPYSRAMGKGKHTPIAKLLRPYKKKNDRDVSAKSMEMMMSPNRASGNNSATGNSNNLNGNSVTPGSNSSKFESSSPAITPFGNHRTPVEVQLQSKLQHQNNNSNSNSNSSDVNGGLPSPSASNDVKSANYGNMHDVTTNSTTRPFTSPTSTSHHLPLLQNSTDMGTISSPRRSPRYNPGDSSMLQQHTSPAPPGSLRRQESLLGNASGCSFPSTQNQSQTLAKSANADLFGSLNALVPRRQQQQQSSSNVDEEPTFWSAKKVDVKEGPSTFTIDNDASVKVWKWQW